jgi:hypothetical protein
VSDPAVAPHAAKQRSSHLRLVQAVDIPNFKPGPCEDELARGQPVLAEQLDHVLVAGKGVDTRSGALGGLRNLSQPSACFSQTREERKPLAYSEGDAGQTEAGLLASVDMTNV